jgi:hypothetical protein
MEDRALRSLWCDGFIPEQYLLDDPTPRVTGRAWIGTGPRKQDRWEFSLFLDKAARTREDVCWETLLPGDEVTGWLGVDLEGRRLRVTPGRAVAA